MKVYHKTCVFCFFPIINKYLCMAKRSLLSRCPSYLRNFNAIDILDFNRLEIIEDSGLDELFSLPKIISFKFKVKSLLPYFQTAPLYFCPFHS